MELNARDVREGAELDADLCVLGAGPAGIALAREFIGDRRRVLVLESGGLQGDDGPQDLNEGAVVGDPYDGPRRTRHRAAGGTVWLWNVPVQGEPGAKYVPLDPHDFEEQADASGSWPFGRTLLEPFYQRAQAVCGLGPFLYEAEPWADERHPCLPLGERLRNRVYQFGAGHIFTRRYPGALRRSENVCLCYHATVCRLEREAGGRRVVAATVSGPSGVRFRVRAAIFVLAAGAIENARLLLLSTPDDTGAPGSGGAWVGRYFMEHMRDFALTLVPRSPELFEEAGFYDAHPARDGTTVGGRIALDEGALRAAGLPNASVTLRPQPGRRPRPRGVMGRLLGRWRRRAAREPNMTVGWSRVRNPSATFDVFQLLVNVEQRPHPENRIALAATRDRLGLPRVEVHWRWRPEEQADLERLRAVLASELQASRLGRVEVRTGVRPDPNAHHHAGTTRMHTDPRRGVVDGDGRLHGTDNLYVTGASVFPRAGFANPTLTIVALALRLADHLRTRG